MSLELIPISGNSYIVSGINSVGVIVNNQQEAILIDSSLNSAKYINRLLQEAGYTVIAIINTHHHPDHCGGNNYFTKKYPALRIYATNVEKPFIEYPMLEINYLSSGAAPFKSMKKNTFLEASPSIVTDIIPNEDGHQIKLHDIILTIYTLPGHTQGMIGIATEDKILYCADAIFGKTVFDKYGILVYTDIAASQHSFEKLLALSNQYQSLIAYHGGKLANPIELIKCHKNKMNQISEFILTSLKNNVLLSIDDITALTIKNFEMANISTPPQYLLCKMSIQAYITYLEQSGKITLTMDDNKLVVHSNQN